MMFNLGRITTLSVCVLAAVALAGCSSSTKRAVSASDVEPSAYSASPVVTSAVPDESGVLSLAGRWYLNDEFERDCYVDLSAQTIDAGRRVARASGECSGLMTHIGGWTAYNGAAEVRLYDKQGRVIGQMQRGAPRSFKGTLHLNNGDTVTASLRQI